MSTLSTRTWTIVRGSALSNRTIQFEASFVFTLINSLNLLLAFARTEYTIHTTTL